VVACEKVMTCCWNSTLKFFKPIIIQPCLGIGEFLLTLKTARDNLLFA